MELRHPRPQALSRSRTALRAALIAAPFVLAFFSGGYFEQARLVAAVAAWIAVAVAALLVAGAPVPRSAPSRLAVAGLAALALWTGISSAWAPLGEPAGDALERDLLYLGALLAAALAFRRDALPRALEPLVATGVLVVVGYALAGRLLPGIVEQDASASAGGRLEQPLTYWNAMGALAAIGLVLCVRLASDRSRADWLRSAAVGAAAPIGLGLYLAFSRGALAAALAGLLVLLVLTPTWPALRAGALALEGAAVSAVAAGLLPGVESLAGSPADRQSDGVLMLSVLVAVVIVVVAVHRYACTAERQGRLRTGELPLGRPGRLALVGSVVAVAAAPYVVALGERSEVRENPAFGAGAQRLGSVGSHRYGYWEVAVEQAAEHPLRGAGAGAFRVAWVRERQRPEVVRDAHSLFLGTLAELGAVGLAALLALLAGVAWAAVRVARLEGAAVAGPVAALAVWLVHAGVDWDWEMPALTLVAVVLAGLLLARGYHRASA